VRRLDQPPHHFCLCVSRYFDRNANLVRAGGADLRDNRLCREADRDFFTTRVDRAARRVFAVFRPRLTRVPFALAVRTVRSATTVLAVRTVRSATTAAIALLTFAIN
jgi:hypothetical protein